MQLTVLEIDRGMEHLSSREEALPLCERHIYKQGTYIPMIRGIFSQSPVEQFSGRLLITCCLYGYDRRF